MEVAVVVVTTLCSQSPAPVPVIWMIITTFPALNPVLDATVIVLVIEEGPVITVATVLIMVEVETVRIPLELFPYWALHRVRLAINSKIVCIADFI